MAPGEEVRLVAPLQGTVVQLPVPIGGAVSVGTIVVVLESMKMEHVVRSPVAGTLTYLDVDVGGLVADGTPLAVVEAGEVVDDIAASVDEVDLDHVRPDLAELFARPFASRPFSLDDFRRRQLHRVRRVRHRRPTPPA